MYILADDDQRLNLILNNISKQKHIKFLNLLASGNKNTTCGAMPGDDQCAFVNVNVKQLGTGKMWKLVSKILNHVPWSFISVSPKLNFTGSQVVTLLNLCDPLEGFQQKWCKKLSQGQIRKTKRGSHLGFQVQQAMNQRFVCVKPPLANLD